MMEKEIERKKALTQSEKKPNHTSHPPLPPTPPSTGCGGAPKEEGIKNPGCVPGKVDFPTHTTHPPLPPKEPTHTGNTEPLKPNGPTILVTDKLQGIIDKAGETHPNILMMAKDPNSPLTAPWLPENGKTCGRGGTPTPIEYEAPKGYDGKMVPNTLNGKGGKGYLDKHGNIWVPTGRGTPNAHGGEHWDVQLTPSQRKIYGEKYYNVYRKENSSFSNNMGNSSTKNNNPQTRTITNFSVLGALSNALGITTSTNTITQPSNQTILPPKTVTAPSNPDTKTPIPSPIKDTQKEGPVVSPVPELPKEQPAKVDDKKDAAKIDDKKESASAQDNKTTKVEDKSSNDSHKVMTKDSKGNIVLVAKKDEYKNAPPTFGEIFGNFKPSPETPQEKRDREIQEGYDRWRYGKY